LKLWNGLAGGDKSFASAPWFVTAPDVKGSQLMEIKVTYWKETDGKYLGYLNSSPDHWTQGDNLDDLKEHLRDLYDMFSAEDIPGIKKVEELEVA
jgi:predicted RNase H-like HicB family nuclease